MAFPLHIHTGRSAPSRLGGPQCPWICHRGHRAVLYSASPLLREAVLPWCTGVPAVDCLILPDFSETDIRNLFALLYDKGHRFCDIVKSMTSFSFARLPLCSVDVSSHSDLSKLKELICCIGTILQFCYS